MSDVTVNGTKENQWSLCVVFGNFWEVTGKNEVLSHLGVCDSLRLKFTIQSYHNSS